MFKKKLNKKSLIALFMGVSTIFVSTIAVATACSKTNNDNNDIKKEGKTTINKLITKSTQKQSAIEVSEKYELSESNENSQFFNTLTDPYKAFEMFAKSLDEAGYEITSYEPLKNSGKSSFLEYAKDINAKVREYVRKVANLPTIKKLRDNNTTVLWAESTQEFDSSDKSKLDLYYFQQQDLFPLLYSQPDDANVPGLGLRFPKPKNHKADKYFDNWHGIGAAQNNASKNDFDWMLSMQEAFYRTADYVFYNYDSNKLAGETTKSQFESFFKSTVNNDKIIPVDFQIEYSSIWGPIGTVRLIQSFAKKLGVSDSELATVKLDWTLPTKQTLKHIRPKNNKDEKYQNFGIFFYNLWDHCVALGIQPDYSSFTNKQGKTYPKVPGFLVDLVDDTKTKFEEFSGKTQNLAGMKLYALAGNNSHINRSFKESIGEGKEILKRVETERGDTNRSRSQTDFKFYDRETNKLHSVNGKQVLNWVDPTTKK
ncbi:iron ABC transporter substrate-binding protein [Ureaplasma urealyticum]|uniref:iron ABC transporter substrate-binding protein n=1 Tax=Ureaplasma urealyticum TaxID=2130 RepID=UPI001F2ABDCD|nr:iron ABC transporter substrate-binding protein [Ureaplasma urealyticum]UIU14858.1 iron ABC transporter substrate-binding protein [Ureaplasma urealyticum]